MNDALGLLLMSAPLWLVHALGVAFVCKSAAPLLRQGQRAGWRSALIAWAATAVILYGPWMFPAAAFLGLASLATLPFLGTALSLNYRIPPRSVHARIAFAAMAGVLGIITTLYLSLAFLVEKKMFP